MSSRSKSAFKMTARSEVKIDMKTIQFFAMGSDLLTALGSIEGAHPIKYVAMSREEKEGDAWPTYWSARSIPNFGVATAPSAIASASYLVVSEKTPVRTRRLVDNDGRIRYFMDQLLNDDSVVFAPGGTWDDKILISGRVGTVSSTIEAQSLMKMFQRQFRSFKQVRAFLVGPEAYQALHGGWRLTDSAESDSVYDLTEK